MRIGGRVPKKRLNITLDHETAERARRYTKRHNTSISRLVGEFLSQLPEAERTEHELTPTVKRLRGIARGGPDREKYRRHLREKYGS
jgi:hypothetical protein